MIALLSPAKSLDLKNPAPIAEATQPLFVPEAEVLIKKLRKLTPKKLGTLMDISDDLAQLNAARYADWAPEHTAESAKQAIYSFNGEVYVGLNAKDFTHAQAMTAQDKLRILSGLYGILRPLDLIRPYRLEMGTSIEISAKAKNLYQYWQKKVTEEINRSGTDLVVNLASAEYFKAVDAKKLNMPVVTCHFKDEKNGQIKIIQFFTKKARGMMARYIVQNNITRDEDLKGFDSEGYTFAPALSTDRDFVFTRLEQYSKSNQV